MPHYNSHKTLSIKYKVPSFGYLSRQTRHHCHPSSYLCRHLPSQFSQHLCCPVLVAHCCQVFLQGSLEYALAPTKKHEHLPYKCVHNLFKAHCNKSNITPKTVQGNTYSPFFVLFLLFSSPKRHLECHQCCFVHSKAIPKVLS